VIQSITRTVVVFAVAVSIGAHWIVLQSVAWGTMIVQCSQQVPLRQAIAQTFDGDHPCGLCKRISAAQHSEKKNGAQPLAVKPDLICATRNIVLLPRCDDFNFARLQVTLSTLAHSPPAPPPRSKLA
jgi:hypothetical protein